MSDKVDFRFVVGFGLLIFFGVVGLILFGVYNLGAVSMCEEAGGVLLEKDNVFRCVNISNLDLCINEGNVIVNKDVNSFNWSGVVNG